MKKYQIIRVFPRKTKMTPLDDYVFIGDPPMFRPEADEVHISVAFMWDLPEAYRLVGAWSQFYKTVKIGGCVFPDNKPGECVQGRYIKEGVIFTSRGCNNGCAWCLVPITEGKHYPVPYKLCDNPIVQDNNILQHEEAYLGKVMKSFESCKSVVFAGGIQPSLVDDRVAYMLSRINVNHLFLACDSDASVKPLSKAVDKLSFLSRDKLRCYIMIGYKEDIKNAEKRLKSVWDIGCLPFAQLYQPMGNTITYNRQWRELARKWSRPAITKAIMK